MEIFILTFLPMCCPNCGQKFHWDSLSTADFRAHAAQSCNNCGAKFQFVEQSALVEAAEKAGGDL